MNVRMVYIFSPFSLSLSPRLRLRSLVHPPLERFYHRGRPAGEIFWVFFALETLKMGV